jgi:hypothetical protein
MDFIKNIHFTLVIRINKRLHEFNFRKRSAEEYDTDTGDDRGNRYYFKMIREDGIWVMHGTGLPSWITENKDGIGVELGKNDPV